MAAGGARRRKKKDIPDGHWVVCPEELPAVALPVWDGDVEEQGRVPLWRQAIAGPYGTEFKDAAWGCPYDATPNITGTLSNKPTQLGKQANIRFNDCSRLRSLELLEQGVHLAVFDVQTVLTVARACHKPPGAWEFQKGEQV